MLLIGPARSLLGLVSTQTARANACEAVRQQELARQQRDEVERFLSAHAALRSARSA